MYAFEQLAYLSVRWPMHRRLEADRGSTVKLKVERNQVDSRSGWAANLALTLDLAAEQDRNAESRQGIDQRDLKARALLYVLEVSQPPPLTSLDPFSPCVRVEAVQRPTSLLGG